MLIVWGTKVNREPRGTVADHCSVCATVSRFDVTDIYEVSHLYFIPLGRGTRVACTQICLRCSTEFSCEPDSYDAYLAPASADAMSLGDIIRITNSRLAEARAARRELEAIARDSTPASEPSTQITTPDTVLPEATTSDDDLREALDRLRPFEGQGTDVTELMKKLRAWRTLDDATRAGLLKEADAYVTKQHHIEKAMEFLPGIADTFPRYLGCLPATFLLAALIAGFVFAPFRWGWCTGSAYVVIGLVVAIGLFYWLTDVIQTRWFRNVLIPEADEEGIDLQTLVVCMVKLGRSKQPLKQHIRDMCCSARLLRLEVLAQERWNMNKTAEN